MDSYVSIEIDNGHSRRKTKLGSSQEVSGRYISSVCLQMYVTFLNVVGSILWALET